MRAFLLQTPGELHFPPQVDVGLLAGTKHRVVRGHARGHDDEVGAGLNDRAGEGSRVLLDVDCNCTDIIEEGGLPSARVERTHLPVAGEQRSRRSLSGLAPADDSSETTHRRDTHSA